MYYKPSQGDIIVIDLNPQSGHEQSGRRLALVISNNEFIKRTNLAVICPITNTDDDYPTHVLLDSSLKTTGMILCEQVKSLDYASRNSSYVETVPFDILDEAIDIVCSFL